LGAKTLEWRTTSPPPKKNFARKPVLDWDIYAYSPESPSPDTLLGKIDVETSKDSDD
jgi:heme/copper-type cytochrome/quinol oxidase subunit 1